jgi:hypothetical protein
MQLHDVAAVLHADGLPAGAALATLEWHHGYQADAEVARLLRQDDGTPQAYVARLRQRSGAVLIRVEAWLAGIPGRGVAPESVPTAGQSGTAG